MQVHRLAVASRQDQGRALALLGTDRAEDVGGSGPLVTRRARAGAALGPAAGDLLFLANAGLVGEPDFYRVAVDGFRTRDRLQTVGEAFLKFNRARRLSVVARSGGQFAVAHGPKFPAERLLGDRDAEFLEDHCTRSISRQRTTPCTAGIGPLLIMPAMAWRWASLSLGG
jgi:hypothetical protein